jgi:hypothetical protein
MTLIDISQFRKPWGADNVGEMGYQERGAWNISGGSAFYMATSTPARHSLLWIWHCASRVEWTGTGWLRSRALSST